MMNLKRYVSPNFCRSRVKPIEMENKGNTSTHHDVKEMVTKAKAIFMNMEFTTATASTQGSIFEEMQADEGWHYILK